MKQSKKIAVTGGIGSGKSLVLSNLKKWGYAVFSCDEIYAELCTEEEFLRGLARLFPFAVKEGALDRATLSSVVFSDSGAREKLNGYTHPLVMERLFARMEGFPLSFAEVPLLFESGYEKDFDGVIVVLREKKARVEAVKRRSGLTEEEVLKRMDSQFGYGSLPEGCFALSNDGTEEELCGRLKEIVASL